MRIAFQTFLIGTALSALAACTTKPIVNPSPLPGGYSHHHQTYSTPPSPEPWGIGYDYSTEKNLGVVTTWREVAQDLIAKFEAETGITAQDIYVAQPELNNAFTYSLDHSLREELRTQGYRLVNAPTPDTIVLLADTYDPEFKDVMRGYVYNDQETHEDPPNLEHKNLVIRLRALQAGNAIAAYEGPYTLPLYGYQDRQLYFPITQGWAELWR